MFAFSGRIAACLAVLSAVTAVAVGSGAAMAAAAGPEDTLIDYNRQIKPLLGDRCYPCHSTS